MTWRVKDSSQKEGNGNFHTMLCALGSCMYIRIGIIVRGIKDDNLHQGQQGHHVHFYVAWGRLRPNP